MVRKRHRTLTATRQKENNQSKSTSSLFSSEMIAKLERTNHKTTTNNGQGFFWCSQWPKLGPVPNGIKVTFFPILEKNPILKKMKIVIFIQSQHLQAT